MNNMHIHCRPCFSSCASLRENRLCFEAPGENLGDARNTLRAGAQILVNPDLREALELYNTVIENRFRDQMTQADRANFFAMLMHRMVNYGDPAENDRLDYVGISRAGMNIASPFSTDPATGTTNRPPGMADDEWNTMHERMQKFGKTWQATRGAGVDGAVLEHNIRRYLTWRDDLNRILSASSIAIPNMQSANAPNIPNVLNRNQYFELLVLISRGRGEAIAKAASGGFRSLSDFLTAQDGATRTALDRANRIRTDLTVDQMGPTEVLSRFGIVLGPILMREYLEARNPRGNANINVPNATLWEARPMLAYNYLMSRPAFRSVAAHERFLLALQHYFDNTPGRVRPVGFDPGMSQGDVEAILSLIVQSLLISDQYVANSRKLESELKNRVNFGQQIEKTGADVWNYVRNFQDHPVGAAVMGLTGFLAAKWLYNQIFHNEHWNITNYIGYGVVGGLAVGLYQQHRTGTAWWHDARNAIDQARGAELALDPRERTLSAYWARLLNLRDVRQKFCLSILEGESISKVLIWYRQKAVNPAANIPMPFPLGQYQNLFGQLPPIEVQGLFFTTLTSFFENRGAAARTGGWHMDARNGVQDNVSLGVDYIWRMFVERRYFRYLAMQVLQTASLSEDVLENWDNKEVQDRLRTTLSAEQFRQLAIYRYIHVQESRTQPGSNWQMYYVFALQMDEGAANRTGVGSVMAQLRTQVTGLEEYLRKTDAPRTGLPVVAMPRTEADIKLSVETAEKAVKVSEAAEAKAGVSLEAARATLETATKTRNDLAAAMPPVPESIAKADRELVAAQRAVALAEARQGVAHAETVHHQAVTVLETRNGELAAARRVLETATKNVKTAVANNSTPATVEKNRKAETEARQGVRIAFHVQRVADAESQRDALILARQRSIEETVLARQAAVAASAAHTAATAPGSTATPVEVAQLLIASQEAAKRQKTAEEAEKAAIAAALKAQEPVKKAQEALEVARKTPAEPD